MPQLQGEGFFALAGKILRRARIVGSVEGADHILLRPHFLGAERHRRPHPVFRVPDDAPVDGRGHQENQEGRSQETQPEQKSIFDHGAVNASRK